MHSSNTPIPPRSAHTRVLSVLAVSALAAVVVQMSQQQLSEAELAKPAPASVARFRLEERAGRFCRFGAREAFSGWVTDHYKDGKLRARSAVVNGKLHGRSEGWFASGGVELSEHFQQGLPHGTRTTWHANGQKRSEGQLVAGQQQGRYLQWDENGNLAVEAEFKAGKPHGLSRSWYPSGCLKAEALMKNGEVQARQFYPDGVQRESTLVAKVNTP
jgi:antitoxin component YwqK of YwqJK toxin-antitoxin module